MAVETPPSDSQLWTSQNPAGTIALSQMSAVGDPAALSSGGTVLKYWTGSAWVAKPIKYWTGSAWVAKPLKRCDSSAWV